jgi:fumarate hydratase subunit beta
MIKVTLPISDEVKKTLKAGDYIYLTGTIYTARDAAHKRLLDLKHKGKNLPIDLNNACIYYTGPTPKKDDRIGSIGPTSSYRMDMYLLEMSMLNCTIGKGPRSPEVQALAKDKGLIYLMAIGGIGAKLSLAVKKMDLVAFHDLGPEAIYRLEVEDFPVIVAYDIYGNTIF